MITAIVIDDDFDTVEVFSEFLILHGVNVLGKAYDGKKGVELYEKTKPDIVFADMMMPHFDGFYLLRELRSKWPQSKVIIVTADIREESEEKLIEYGANAIIFKPFKMVHVSAALKHTLNNEIVPFNYCNVFQ